MFARVSLVHNALHNTGKHSAKLICSQRLNNPISSNEHGFHKLNMLRISTAAAENHPFLPSFAPTDYDSLPIARLEFCYTKKMVYFRPPRSPVLALDEDWDMLANYRAFWQNSRTELTAANERMR